MLFFRESEAKGYAFCAQPQQYGVIACAALNRPRLSREGRLQDDDAATMLAKMRCVLWAAHEQGFDGAAILPGFRSSPICFQASC